MKMGNFKKLGEWSRNLKSLDPMPSRQVLCSTRKRSIWGKLSGSLRACLRRFGYGSGSMWGRFGGVGLKLHLGQVRSGLEPIWNGFGVEANWPRVCCHFVHNPLRDSCKALAESSLAPASPLTAGRQRSERVSKQINKQNQYLREGTTARPTRAPGSKDVD